MYYIKTIQESDNGWYSV